MYFSVEHLPNISGEEEIPPIPLLVRDDVLRNLVKQGSLQASDVSDPAKVIEAIGMFLRGMLSDSTPQKATSATRQ
jgi:hypothetical protein